MNECVKEWKVVYLANCYHSLYHQMNERLTINHRHHECLLIKWSQQLYIDGKTEKQLKHSRQLDLLFTYQPITL